MASTNSTRSLESMGSRDSTDYLNDNLLKEPDQPPRYESSSSRVQGVQVLPTETIPLRASERVPAPSKGTPAFLPPHLPAQQSHRKFASEARRRSRREIFPARPREVPTEPGSHTAYLSGQTVSATRAGATQDVTPPEINQNIRQPITTSTTHFPTPKNKRLVIAIDYGTTYTGCAFSFSSGQAAQANLENIEVLQDWTPTMSDQQKVRSRIAYMGSEVEWGSDISDEAVTEVNTKLELEPQETRLDELELLLHVVENTGGLGLDNIREAGPNPLYTPKAPTQIVKDYLTKICECALVKLDNEQLKNTKTPVDVVVTIPVKWSDEATNSTFQAIRGAGFNKTNFPTLKDTILISEPEAAAYFTARDLQEGGTDFLEQNDCFTLCDAGGGTVDVVSFEVKKVDPYLELEKATAPTNGKYGSALIDTAFKKWLRKVIGVDAYAQIDPINARQRISPHTAESGPIRELIRRFEEKKIAFSISNQAPIRLDLPPPLDGLDIEDRVSEGELTIHWNEMAKLFEECVSGVVELIEDQLEMVAAAGKYRRVKNVFLVGGFGASPYLQEMLRTSLDMRRIKLRRPDADKSQTAVVQGAVIYGLEKTRHNDVTFISGFTKSYGIVLPDNSVGGRFEWLVKKGDVIRSNQGTILQSSAFWVSAEEISSGRLALPYFTVFSYDHKDDDYGDDAPDLWKNGQWEVQRPGSLDWDYTRFAAWAPSALASNIKYGPLRWHLVLKGTSMTAEVRLDKDVPGNFVGRVSFKVEVEQPGKQSTDL